MSIDLRSDTITRPTPAMRDAMAHADVGDDVYGEDPTVNRLQERVAAITGKEAAVFVASGTMGNLASVLSHCQRGQEVILGDESHIFHYEAGGASALGGAVLHPVPTRADGTLPLEAIERAIRATNNLHYAPAGVICLENTHNRCGGTVIPAEYFAEVAALARRHGLPVHLDGARLFNAAVATGRPVTAWTTQVDSVQVCLSKGLGAPVGSVVAGSRAVVDRVARLRKMLGGGMRQVGVIAAAGMVALDTMVDRLADDHRHARALAEGLVSSPGIQLDLERVQTNIVIFRLETSLEPAAFLRDCRAAGVLLTDMGQGAIRAVTHADVSAHQCDEALQRIRQVLHSHRAGAGAAQPAESRA